MIFVGQKLGSSAIESQGGIYIELGTQSHMCTYTAETRETGSLGGYNVKLQDPENISYMSLLAHFSNAYLINSNLMK